MGFSKSADNSAASVPASASASASLSPSTSAPGSVEEPTTSSRSFFSRFSLPLRSRARNIADFHIRPAEPHRKYGAGDHVQGAVILTVVKPVRITHLTVSLHGYMRVYKGPNIPLNEPIINPAEVQAGRGRGARQKGHGAGHVSLFQDEQVLSSDGRLEPGRYEFNFDLLFPPKGLPSSIDFERGTISYMITATLTRPTPLAPTTSCERKVFLVEKVDVGPLTPPRSRTIYLEPISKRSKKKKHGSNGGTISTERNSVASDTPEPASDLDSTRANENSTEGSLSVIGEDQGQDLASNNPRSPVQSDVRSVSGDSAASGSTGLSRAGGDTKRVSVGLSGKKTPSVRDRTITATIELLKGGCIPGDLVPVKISVQHIRRIKSMHGVIVTLYRQGRIDSAPPIALSRELSKDEARRLEKEEYYPKSKTGLGGLSLSSAGSCSVFRKDLSQAFTPLIIDPATLTATLTTSVRIPEDVFPTIKGVPGDMITFKYQVEVIVDLGGKLANQIQGGKLPGARLATTSGPLGLTGSPYEGGAASLTSWGTSIIDTDRLRREKGVIAVAFEVIVGTTDSSRLRGKSAPRPTPSIYTLPAPVRDVELMDDFQEARQPWPASPDVDTRVHETYSQEFAPRPQPAQQYSYWNSTSPVAPSAPHYIPPPEVPDESALSEKERVRRAEQRLLPSQPTEPLAGPSNVPPVNGDNIYDADDQPETSGAPPALTEPLPGEPPDHLETPSAPTLEDLSPSNQAPPTEDKQELERRRLLAEASAPPEFPDDYDDGGPSSSAAASGASPAAFEPSAPVLEDEDHYGPNYAYASVSAPPHPPTAPAEPLPRYER